MYETLTHTPPRPLYFARWRLDMSSTNKDGTVLPPGEWRRHTVKMWNCQCWGKWKKWSHIYIQIQINSRNYSLLKVYPWLPRLMNVRFHVCELSGSQTEWQNEWQHKRSHSSAGLARIIIIIHHCRKMQFYQLWICITACWGCVVPLETQISLFSKQNHIEITDWLYDVSTVAACVWRTRPPCLACRWVSVGMGRTTR